MMTFPYIKMSWTNGIRPLLILAIAAYALAAGTPASAELKPLPYDKTCLAKMPENDTCLKAMATAKASCESTRGTVVQQQGGLFCKTPDDNSTTQGKPAPKPDCTLRPGSC